MRNILIISGFSLMLLFGCQPGCKYTTPELPVPCEWKNSSSRGVSNAPSESVSWWNSLNDPVLNSLILRAAESNLDVSIALTRVLISRESRIGTGSSNLPHLDATMNAGNLGFNNRLLKSALGSSCIKHSQNKSINFFELGFDAEWEIDLFGKNLHESAAAIAEEQAASESVRDLLVTLYAEIGKNYVELRNFQSQLQLLEETIQSQQESLSIARSSYEAGFSGILEQWEVEEQLYQIESEKPLIQLAIQQSINRLSTLVGQFPGELSCELYLNQKIPTPPQEVAIGIPSDLLRNRPDIRQAERQLAAAAEKVGSAIADLFPRLSLRGFVGDITGNLNKSGLAWYAGPEILAPIFNSRAIQQSIDLNKINQRQAFFTYQKAVLGALEEAENAIDSYRSEGERNIQLHTALELSEEIYVKTLDLYQQGFKEYTEVLHAQRSYLNRKLELLKSDSELTKKYIALYKALGGGGWECIAIDGVSCTN